MWVEGLVEKDYFNMMQSLGYKFDWEEEAEDGDVRVRIWVEQSIEEYFPPKDLVKEDKKILALMATSKNKILYEFASKELSK